MNFKKDSEIWITREFVYYRDGGTCQKCGQVGSIDKMQLAHRIPKGKKKEVMIFWWDKFGKDINITDAGSILNHPINLKLSCPTDECNSSFLIASNPVEKEKILTEIYNDKIKN